MEASISPFMALNESSYGNLKIRTAGEPVLMTEVEQGQGESIFFEHHGRGNVFEKTLPGEHAIDLEHGGFLCKDASVQMATNSMGIETGMIRGVTILHECLHRHGENGHSFNHVPSPNGRLKIRKTCKKGGIQKREQSSS